jgi:hypothetical protein
MNTQDLYSMGTNYQNVNLLKGLSPQINSIHANSTDVTDSGKIFVNS